MGSQIAKTVKAVKTVPAPHAPVAFDLELHRLIEVEAYEQAAKDNFKQHPNVYWLAAEKVVGRDF